MMVALAEEIVADPSWTERYAGSVVGALAVGVGLGIGALALFWRKYTMPRQIATAAAVRLGKRQNAKGDEYRKDANSEGVFAKYSAAFVALVAATIIEAISGFFFVIPDRASKTMSDFFDRLRRDMKLDRAVTMASQVQNADVKAKLQAALALGLNESGADRKSTQ